MDHELTELLVHGREEAFYGYEFAIQGGGKSLPQDALAYYYDLFRDSGALRASFGLYRAWDDILAQNAERAKQPSNKSWLSRRLSGTRCASAAAKASTS